jgi:hypothetical protein
MSDAANLSPRELERLRRRTVATLVAGVALGSTGHIAAVTVATIVATHIAGGTTAWSGAPGATVVLGAAAGAISLSALMVRRGRRSGGLRVPGGFDEPAEGVRQSHLIRRPSSHAPEIRRPDDDRDAPSP